MARETTFVKRSTLMHGKTMGFSCGMTRNDSMNDVMQKGGEKINAIFHLRMVKLMTLCHFFFRLQMVPPSLCIVG